MIGMCSKKKEHFDFIGKKNFDVFFINIFLDHNYFQLNFIFYDFNFFK